MDALDLLASDNYITYNKVIAKQYGIEVAILLGAMCGYQRGFGNQEFFRTEDEISEDTGLSIYNIRNGKRILESEGILSITKKGLPAKHWFYINVESLLSTTSGIKFATTGSIKNDTTRDTINDTTNKNKDKNNIKKEIKKKKEFTPPTLVEVREYAKEKGYAYLANKFYDYFTTGDWVDSKGQKVKNWKQKFITWATYTSKPTFGNQRGYTAKEMDELIQNIDDIEI